MVQTLVGIDLGTTKNSAVIAEVDSNGEVQIVGVGVTASSGMRRGVVVNMERTISAIREAVDQAEQMAGVKVREAYVGIVGDHIRSINSKGTVAVARAKRDNMISHVTPLDVDRVIESAKALSLPMDRELIHVIPQEYTVDDEIGVKDPIGLSGRVLKADVHIITGAVASAQNIHSCVRQAGLTVRTLVLEPLASSYAVLNDDDKELGVILLDIGGGTTDIAVFNRGAIRHTGVISLGGNIVTQDIARLFHLNYDTAERIKVEYGAITPPTKNTPPIIVNNQSDGQPIQIDPAELNRIIWARMDEIFRLTFHELRRIEGLGDISGGIVLTGGGAMLRGCVNLAEDIFKLPVRIGIPSGVMGLADTVNNPAFATSIGLILYAINHDDVVAFDEGGDSSIFDSIIKIFKNAVKGLIE